MKLRDAGKRYSNEQRTSSTIGVHLSTVFGPPRAHDLVDGACYESSYLMAIKSLSVMAIIGLSGMCQYRDAHRLKSVPTCSLRTTSRSRHARPLRAAARGSERSVALHSARRRHHCMGDGQTDASGGGFDHRMMDIKYRERKRPHTDPFILTDNSRHVSWRGNRSWNVSGASKMPR